MKVGIFGGTFDPPHLGHLILAAEALEQLQLDQVFWVLTPFPPHKQGQKISSIEHRMTMVLLAIAENSNFCFSRVDVDRPPPQYALDTVNLLRQASSRDTFYYLMGADSLNDLPEWHDPLKFIEACDGLGIMKRQDEYIETSRLETLFPGLIEKLRFLNTPFIDISGRDIRERVKTGKQFRYFVPEKIYHYILNHKLYQS